MYLKFDHTLQKQTYQAAKENIDKNLHSLEYTTDSLTHKSCSHPLENILLDLFYLKANYLFMPLTTEYETNAMALAKEGIKTIRNIVFDAIVTLPDDELLSLSFARDAIKEARLLPI
ncbi:MAG: hypothetical protein H0U57_03065 [Tatlockia sp.]|nr:hypothetical protein [Tatlockia sp.]